MEQAFSPLDEELQLPAGSLTPLLLESLVRVSSWMPFAAAAELLHFISRTTVSSSMARRQSETIGLLAESALQQSEARAGVGATEPSVGVGSEHLYVGVDGAMVPLVRGEWGEVKTLSIGVVGPARLKDEEWVVQTAELSYFSRMMEVDKFIAEAGYEIERRQVAQAGRISALSDGAVWIQGFFDDCCPESTTRILDYPHAVGYLVQVASAYFATDKEARASWLNAQMHQLLTGDAKQVVAELLRLSLAAYDEDADESLQEVIATAHDYLKARLPMIQYATFKASGAPIGSGASESANKLVVQRRLKGAGMHWQRTNVNPMLALVNASANQRWDELWPAAIEQQRAERMQRRLASHTSLPADPPPMAPAPEKNPWRPAPDHPWRRTVLSSPSTTHPA